MQPFAPEDVLKRQPLLQRIAAELGETSELRRRKQERLEELIVISRKFSSPEIQETISNLRNHIAELKRQLEGCEKEIRDLGGTLHDQRKGIIYFNSEKDDRPILLVWDPSEAEPRLSWHEVDQSFADRTPLFPRGAGATS